MGVVKHETLVDFFPGGDNDFKKVLFCYSSLFFLAIILLFSTNLETGFYKMSLYLIGLFVKCWFSAIWPQLDNIWICVLTRLSYSCKLYLQYVNTNKFKKTNKSLVNQLINFLCSFRFGATFNVYRNDSVLACITLTAFSCYFYSILRNQCCIYNVFFFLDCSQLIACPQSRRSQQRSLKDSKRVVQIAAPFTEL